jgi:sensor histidine kinase YesM
MLIAVFATANLGPQQGPRRAAALATAVVLSTGFAETLRILYKGDWSWWNGASGMLAYVWPRYAILAGMLTLVVEFYRREMASLAAAQRALLDHAAFEREMAEARLAVLQAQIEPHFLFNTLANVRRLYDQDPAAGRTMLVNIMRYFEVALPRIRSNGSTLERDADLVEAYLQIQQIRMGQRLEFSVGIPEGLRAHPLPSMMLLSLVENAIKHGINPSSHGGRIDVTAYAEDENLLVRVIDTGVGFAPGSGVGHGLANISARLTAQFGHRAHVTLENNERGGATASLILPLFDASPTN